MWHTQLGDRVLRGSEAKVFALSVLDLVENELTRDNDFTLGIRLFDSLTYPQRLAILHQVANALFRPEVPMPELTAVLEAAVAAVLQNAYGLVEEEVDIGEGTAYRRLVLDACRELGIGKEVKLPRVSCDDPHEWLACVDYLYDAILWDSDYDTEPVFVDLPPERSDRLKEQMGVPDGYFTAVAPEPPPQQVEVLIAELRPLCLTVAEKGHPVTEAKHARKRRD